MNFNILRLDNLMVYEVYSQILIYILYSFGIALLFLTLSYLLAIQSPYFEKLTAYECGFEPFEDARNQFNVSFYIVAILFLIFDVELLYLFPWCLVVSYCGTTGFWTMIIFLLILAVGFLYEVMQGALNWP